MKNNHSYKHKILIIDDDRDILDLLQYNLKKEGYEVLVVSKSTEGVNTALHFRPELIILDILMPKLNGIEVCRRLRNNAEFMHTYIFFLTALSGRQQQREAFDIGGDDFIQKLTGLRTLFNKIRAVLDNKLVIRKHVKKIQLGALTIDRSSRLLVYKNRKIVLSESEFEIVYFFAQNPDIVISADHLLDNIGRSDFHILPKTLGTRLKDISKKIGAELIRQVQEDRYRLASTF